jgi:hypothetical protein
MNHTTVPPSEGIFVSDAELTEHVKNVGWGGQGYSSRLNPLAPAPKSKFPLLVVPTLSPDQIQELAEEFQCELLHCGVESFTLERMIRHSVSYAEEYLAEDNPSAAVTPAQLDAESVRRLAREFMGELLSNGVEGLFLRQMIGRALSLAYGPTETRVE